MKSTGNYNIKNSPMVQEENRGSKQGILFFLLLIFLLVIGISSCKYDKAEDTVKESSFTIIFSHLVNGNALLTDTLIYSEPPGNSYMVSDLQYFISDLVFYRRGGTATFITDDDSIHYTDIRVPSTLSWKLNTPIPSGIYDSVSFVFGLNEMKNRSNRFPDPPERDMFWPDILGGGYHYMKMNLKWKNDTMAVSQPFSFHLGIGQTYSSTFPNPDSITAYIQNSFTVTLPLQALELKSNAVQAIEIQMNIEKWFYGEQLFDFATYPDGTMQYESAIHSACLNGKEAFGIKLLK